MTYVTWGDCVLPAHCACRLRVAGVTFVLDVWLSDVVRVASTTCVGFRLSDVVCVGVAGVAPPCQLHPGPHSAYRGGL
jgi:hypothetical protein